ncbi:hypothetical protein BHM03_00052501 [Ensete ventricosum]|nr:hypothetical protein BHM03_00052501 [Ensete ventricosum]
MTLCIYRHHNLLIEAKTSVSSPSIENEEDEGMHAPCELLNTAENDKIHSSYHFIYITGSFRDVAAEGVDSVAIEGEDKDHLVVVGDGVDPANLTCILRKKVGHAKKKYSRWRKRRSTSLREWCNGIPMTHSVLRWCCMIMKAAAPTQMHVNNVSLRSQHVRFVLSKCLLRT